MQSVYSTAPADWAKEIRLEEPVKKLRKQNDSAKEEKTGKDRLGWEDQNKTADESNNTTWGDTSKDTGEKRETQKIPKQGQAIQTKRDIPK